MFFSCYIRMAKIRDFYLILCDRLTFFYRKMINNFLLQQIKEFFPYQPTLEQEKVLKSLASYIADHRKELVFILNGYAGTGKTLLVSALVKALDQLHSPVVLMAPTGRSAKILNQYAEHPAYTIHKRIYRLNSFTGGVSEYSLAPNLTKGAVYIVDEASMIANSGLSGSEFGSGRLLDDLVAYVESGTNCRLILLGDTAQLPPVGESESPALSAEVLRGYGLEVMEEELVQVVRQDMQSGILWNATQLRQLVTKGDCHSLPIFKLSGYQDVKLVSGADLIDTLEACYQRDGRENTTVICRSNKRANIYNNGIRNRILWYEEELETGDILMVTKNNYFWVDPENDKMDFIANGEIAVVKRVRKVQSLYGFRFASVTLSFPNFQDCEKEVNLMLDTLQSESVSLTNAENNQLFTSVLEDYAEITNQKERIKKLKTDPYFNALQVKYAYAVTCHKAQGGQWKNVFIDQGYMKEELLTTDYFRWLYTAFTRATGTLYLVNYPKDKTC